MIAAKNEQMAVLRVLLAAGADKEAREKDGWTALVYAASLGKVEPLACLLAAGADVNVRSTAGRSACFIAAREGHADAVAALIAAGADVTVVDNESATALSVAKTERIRSLLRAATESKAAAAAAAEAARRATREAAAAAEAAAAQRAADAAAAAKAAEDREKAVSAFAVPLDVRTWLAGLQLSSHAQRLCFDHKIAFLADCKAMEEGDLVASGVSSKVERTRFLHAAARLAVGTPPTPGTRGMGSPRDAAAAAAPASAAAPAAAIAGKPTTITRVRALVIGIDEYASPVRPSSALLFVLNPFLSLLFVPFFLGF